MALQSLPGPYAYLGPNPVMAPQGLGQSITALAGANRSFMAIGRMMTSDQGSHTINTTGSSSIGWRSSSITFASGSTSVSVGIAPVDLSNGPVGRAVNSAGTVTFDVAAVFAGGGGGITASAWQTSVPTTGSKTISHGDLVCIAVQMTARGGSDSITVAATSVPYLQFILPVITIFDGSSTYSQQASAQVVPDFFVTFADGATGWITGSEIFSSLSSRTWNSGSATKEYGQLYQMPFPMKVCGMYGWGLINGDETLTLYSDPLGTPVAQRSSTITYKSLSSGQYFISEIFSTPYSVSANQPIAAIYTPSASNATHYYKTLGNATNRAADPWGTSGYGVSRASGAFSNANSSLDHYYIGLLVSAFDDAVGGGGGGGGSIGVIGS